MKCMSSEDAASARAEPRYEIYKDAAGKFRFRLRAPNGQIIAVGEAYESKAGCEKGIASVKENAAKATIEDLTEKAERILENVEDIRNAQTIQEKQSLASLFTGTLLGALIGVLGNFIVSFVFQPPTSANIIGLIVSLILFFVVCAALFLESKKYAARAA